MDLKRKRTQLRREFTTLADKTEKAIEGEDDSAGQFFDFLSETASELFEVEAAVRDQWCAAEDFDEAQFQADQDKSMLYKLRWHKVKSMFPKNLPRSNSTNSLQSAESSQKPKTGKQRLPTLPRLELSKFDGNVKSWLQFWGQFRKVHEDANIDPCDKFQYLLQSMTPNSAARQLVESYPPCAENYCKAVEALKTRFARDDVLIETYVRGLLSLMQRKEAGSDLTALYDNLQTHLQALGTLGVTNDKYATMLFPMIESALPEEVLRAWYRSHPETRNLSKVMLFLRQEVESEERIRLARRDFSDMSPAEPKPPTACFVTEFKQDKEGKKNGSSCVWCDKDNHSAVECHKAAKMTLQDRLDFIQSKKACSICLKSNHVAKKCKSFPRCLFCQKRHFTIMCTELAAKNTDTQNSQNKQQERSLSCHTQSASTTLLQTVIVKIVHGKKETAVRALIDSGAQRSYIKKDLARKLGLKPTSNETVTHSLFGGIETKKKKCHVYDISVKNLDDNFSMNLHVLEQNVICSSLPKLKSSVLLGQLCQRGIVLHDSTDAPDDVSLLIGADCSGSLFTGQFVQLDNNLTAVKTTMGWTIQGTILRDHSSTTNATTSTLQCLTKVAFPELQTSKALGIRDPAEQGTKSIRNTEVLAVKENVKSNEKSLYESSLPWRDVLHPDVNYDLTKKRLNSGIKHLKR